MTAHHSTLATIFALAILLAPTAGLMIVATALHLMRARRERDRT